MRCPYCGSENKQQSKFCVRCGKTLLQKSLNKTGEPVKTPGKKNKKKGKVGLSVLLCVVMIILVGCLVLLAMQFIAPEESQEVTQEVTEATQPEEPSVDASYQETEAYCAALEQQGEYLAAVRYLDEKIDAGYTEVRYFQLQGKYRQMYEASVMDVVNAYVDQGQYQLAIETLYKAEEEYSSETFRTERIALEKRLQTPLTACRKLEDTNSLGKEEDIAVGNWKDTFGTTHESALRFWVVDRENFNNTEYITYALEGKYKTLSGEIVASEKSDSGSHGSIMIYLDDALIYTSPKVYTNSQPIGFEVDVSNGQQLRVVCTTESDIFNYCIVDANLFET